MSILVVHLQHQTNKNMSDTTTHTIQFYGQELEVTGSYDAGSPQTRDYPGDSPSFEIEEVWAIEQSRTYWVDDSVNITPLLSNLRVNVFEEIEQHILDTCYD